MAEEHKFLAKVQSFESIFFIVISIIGLQIKQHELIVVGAMILTKLIGTVGFVLPRLMKRTGIRLRYFVLYSLFEPALLALATGALQLIPSVLPGTIGNAVSVLTRTVAPVHYTVLALGIAALIGAIVAKALRKK